MDKQTLSNYGWIVVVILVLSVMIAMATPFGSFIAGGFKSITTGLFDVNQGAVNNLGFGQIPDQSFDDSYDGTSSSEGKLAPGLYDADDVLLADWDTLVNVYGLNVEEDAIDNDEYFYAPIYDIIRDNAHLSTGVKLVIAEGITRIGEHVFQEVSASLLKEVVLSSTITEIAPYAFMCAGIEKIVIPDGITEIQKESFSSCVNLKTVVLPDGLTTIADGAFRGAGIENINIPDSVQYIGTEAFYSTRIESITIPEGITTISEEAFLYCSYLTAVILPNTLKTIERGAFQKCTSLATIHIPDGVETIKDAAFYSSGLTTIDLPDSVTSLGASVFYFCYKLQSVKLPAHITSIESSTFNRCDALTDIVLPDGITSIGNNAFERCEALSQINLPEGLTAIGDGAFYGCVALKNITFPSTLQSIGMTAFRASGLTSAFIPASVTVIDRLAFDCDNMQTLTFEKTSGWKRGTSKGFTSGTSVSLTSPTQNAVYFNDTYANYFWRNG